jgi:hypothetical protein
MNVLFEPTLNLIYSVSEQIMSLFPFFGGETLPLADSGFLMAMAAGITSSGDSSSSATPKSVLASARLWHGNIEERFTAIDNLTDVLTAHPNWPLPEGWLADITEKRNHLSELIPHCRSRAASSFDRETRNILLEATVKYCLTDMKSWAHAQCATKNITVENVHQLGFLMLGEEGGNRGKTDPTKATADLKVSVLNEDIIHVVIDQAAEENAALVEHGWPYGVHFAVVVILNSDGKTEIYRQVIHKLHNDITMPEGSHGKQFIIKAAFLKHTTDTPKFGNEVMFSMPTTLSDFAALHEKYKRELEELKNKINNQENK